MSAAPYLHHELKRLFAGNSTNTTDFFSHGDDGKVRTKTKDSVKPMRLTSNVVSEINQNFLNERRFANVLGAKWK